MGADDEGVRHESPTAGTDLADHVDIEVRAPQMGEQVLDGARSLSVLAGDHAGPRIGGPHRGEGVGDGDHQWASGSEDAVHLAQGAGQVVDLVQGVVGHHEVDRGAGGETEVRGGPDVSLDGEAELAGAPTQVVDASRIRIEGDCLRAAGG